MVIARSALSQRIRLTLGQPDQQADRLGLTQMGYVLLHRVAGLAVVRLTEAVADN